MSTADTNLGCERGKACGVLTRLASALRAWFRLSTLGERIQNLLRRLVRQVLLFDRSDIRLSRARYTKTHVEIIPNNHHWCITAGALALDLNDREFPVLRCLAGFDTA